jgi:four helix bundle protein
MEEVGYKNNSVWQRSMELVIKIYSATSLLPIEEKYGLISQMRRAAVSIPSNIAEGYRRGHRKEYIQFLNIAFGSAAELETQIEISKRIYNINFTEASDLLEQVLKLLNVIIRRLSAKILPTPYPLLPNNVPHHPGHPCQRKR